MPKKLATEVKGTSAGIRSIRPAEMKSEMTSVVFASPMESEARVFSESLQLEGIRNVVVLQDNEPDRAASRREYTIKVREDDQGAALHYISEVVGPAQVWRAYAPWKKIVARFGIAPSILMLFYLLQDDMFAASAVFVVCVFLLIGICARAHCSLPRCGNYLPGNYMKCPSCGSSVVATPPADQLFAPKTRD